MTKKNEGWLSRRGQADAASAVELVLERQPQEAVQQIADELIEDSPFQVRQPINDASVSELVQGMASTGFQGVLIVRPHSDSAKRRQGHFQLVYGHRRRAAWRILCQERGELCVLPVVVREISDEQMLTIGAQENLQRQDLDPVEEAQLVAWLERSFPTYSQSELGALIGKSSDWMSLRVRVHRLPAALKERLRERPRAITHMLELGGLFERDPQTAIAYADRVVRAQVSLDDIRALVRAYIRPAKQHLTDRDVGHNRRGAATIVPNVTDAGHDQAATLNRHAPSQPIRAISAPEQPHEPSELDLAPAAAATTAVGALKQFQEVVTLLEGIADNARELPIDATTLQTLARAERSLMVIRHIISRAWVKQRGPDRKHQ